MCAGTKRVGTAGLANTGLLDTKAGDDGTCSPVATLAAGDARLVTYNMTINTMTAAAATATMT